MTTDAAVQHRHVLVVEDDALLRTQLVHSLAQAGYSVTAHASVDALADAPLPDGPCVALLDLRLGQGSGLDALHLLRRRQPGLAVVFISGGSHPQEVVQAMKLGATDFLVKPFTLHTLRAALERGMAQEQARLARAARRSHARALFARLTPRERELGRLVAQGLGSTELAAHLGQSPDIVETHRQQVMEKLGLDSLPRLVALLRDAALEETGGEAAEPAPAEASSPAAPAWADGVDIPIDVPSPGSVDAVDLPLDVTPPVAASRQGPGA